MSDVISPDEGRVESAIAHIRLTLDRDPDNARTWHDLAALLQLRGELEAAVATYRRALEADPTLGSAHAGAAGALYRLERFEESLGHLDAFCAQAPDPTATAVRAHLLLRLERYTDAIDAAERELTRQPENIILLETLGCGLRALGRFDEAFAVFDRAIALGHNLSSTLVFKASGLLETGNFTAARTALESALALEPGNAAAWLALGELESDAPGNPPLARMEELLASAAELRNRDPRMTMHFALGRAYHKAGDTASAFRHYAAGNTVKRATLTYDVADDERFARDTIAFFTPARLARLSGTGAPSRAPIFVLGMPRSGTSLVEQILASHPDVHGAGELTLFDQAVEEIGREDVAALGTRYLELLDRIAPADKRVVDKLPSNFRNAALIHLALPRARIVHCRRDPLDTCWSCYATLFTGRQDFAFDLSEAGRYYRAYDALSAHWRAVLPPDVMLEIDYEELIADVESGARRLLAFCDLPWNDTVLRFYETSRPVRTASYAQVRRPIYTTSIGSARPYRAHLQPLVDALEGKIAAPTHSPEV